MHRKGTFHPCRPIVVFCFKWWTTIFQHESQPGSHFVLKPWRFHNGVYLQQLYSLRAYVLSSLALSCSCIYLSLVCAYTFVYVYVVFLFVNGPLIESYESFMGSEQKKKPANQGYQGVLDINCELPCVKQNYAKIMPEFPNYAPNFRRRFCA